MRKRNSKLFKTATKQDIGATAIPADNSFCCEMPTQFEAMLAKKEVVIATWPVLLKVRGNRKGARVIEREFVLVTYQGNVYRVLNCFYEIKRPTNWISSADVANFFPHMYSGKEHKLKFGEQDEVSCGVLGVLKQNKDGSYSPKRPPPLQKSCEGAKCTIDGCLVCKKEMY